MSPMHFTHPGHVAFVMSGPPRGDGPPFRGRRGRRGGFGPAGPPSATHRFGPRRGGGQRLRRGDTRDAVLLRLLDGPKHGYQVMSEIAELSKEQWTPGPGSIYPVVRSLAETGLVEVNEVDGRRVITLTEHGRQIAEARRDAGPAPWDRVSADDASPAMELRSAIGRLIPALKQLGREGSDAAIAEIAQRLDTLRRDAYRLLADDAPDTSEAPDAADAD